MSRIVLPGQSYESFYKFPLQSMRELKGAFCCQEYIQARIRRDPSDLSSICDMPEDYSDEAVWVLEHLRQLLTDINQLLVALRDDCTVETCPKMCVGNFEYLCAAHNKGPIECCAVDYGLHTVAAFISLLNNPSEFRSRVVVSKKGSKNFGNIARRVYRVLSHAFTSHANSFVRFEAQHYVAHRFIYVCRKFKLMESKAFGLMDVAAMKQLVAAEASAHH
ncbi:MAG: hypothetical protein MHM6MM_005794 [Cercozoa sp. M6MM]